MYKISRRSNNLFPTVNICMYVSDLTEKTHLWDDKLPSYQQGSQEVVSPIIPHLVDGHLPYTRLTRSY